MFLQNPWLRVWIYWFIIRIRIDSYELFSIPQDETRCEDERYSKNLLASLKNQKFWNLCINLKED